MTVAGEHIATFDCFGSTCSVLVAGDGPERSAQQALALARQSLLEWHERFSRFEPDSELSRLNRDPRRRVTVSPLMARLAHAVVAAGSLSGGLVDATLVEEIEDAGYDRDIADPLALASALELAPARSAARPARRGRWQDIEVSLEECAVTRPPGVKLDSGGIAKGLFADVLAEMLAGHAAYAVNCAGDLRVGGNGAVTRPIKVESPFDGSVLHTWHSRSGGVATSGIGRRSWRDTDGLPAHHLLDPSTCRAAFTGVVQTTALASSAVIAEVRAKAALLSGPGAAARWLSDGGVIVLDDGSHQVIAPPPSVTLSELSVYARGPLSPTAEHA